MSNPQYEDGNGKLKFMDRDIAQLFSRSNDMELQEPSMAGFANGLHDVEKLDNYTEYENKDDVIRMNTFIGCARNVSTNVFGNSNHIKQSVKQLLESAHDHKMHMRSHKRKGALESVSVARGGYDVVKSTKDLEKQLHLRR